MRRRGLSAVVVVPTLLVGSCAALSEVAPQQALIKAPLGLFVRLATPSEQLVQLTVELPEDYGLTPEERRQDWPALNHTKEQTFTLEREALPVRFPPAYYCAHYFRWNGPPPPPARFVLRFSDAPDETYLVWGRPNGSRYLVENRNGAVTQDEARWALRISPLTREGVDSDAPWTVDVDVFPQAPVRRAAAVQP